MIFIMQVPSLSGYFYISINKECFTLSTCSMEAKKTPQADLSNKSFLFFNIGLIISLLAAITAFNYKVYDDTKLKDLVQNHIVHEEIAEVPLTDLPPPPPPRIEQ